MLEPVLQLQAHNAAAILTAGVVSNLPDTLEELQPKDSPRLQLYNLITWEVHRIYYHAIVSTLGHADWPAPKLEIDLTGLFGQVTDLIGADGLKGLLPLLQGLFGNLPALPAPVQPTEPVPPPAP